MYFVNSPSTNRVHLVFYVGNGFRYCLKQFFDHFKFWSANCLFFHLKKCSLTWWPSGANPPLDLNVPTKASPTKENRQWYQCVSGVCSIFNRNDFTLTPYFARSTVFSTITSGVKEDNQIRIRTIGFPKY